jgi:hypothetical protein
MEDLSERAWRSVEPYAQQKSTGGRRSRSGPASSTAVASCIGKAEAVAQLVMREVLMWSPEWREEGRRRRSSAGETPREEQREKVACHV